MMIKSEVERVTEQIVERSKSSRAAYRKKIEAHITASPARNHLSCGNLAHAVAAQPKDNKDKLLQGKINNLAIISSYNDMLSAHQPFYRFPEIIKKAAYDQGASAQFSGGVPAMCDGVIQGQDGMQLSLFSRDVIAMATAVSLAHDMFDGMLMLGVCDKIVPGLLIGALSFGHLPCVFIPAGPMPSGLPNSEKARIRQLFAQGKVGRDRLLKAESESYHSPGTCTFYGTANSNQMLMEIMGLQLPGSSFVPPDTVKRDALTYHGVEILLQQASRKTPIVLADIVSEKTLVNALVGLLATGGSTNHTIHLIAIGRAAGIKMTWQDMADLSAIVPLVCRIYPNGMADINHFHAAGGMGYLMKELAGNGYLHTDVKTILGEGLDAYFQEPVLVQRNENLIPTGETTYLDSAIQWQASPETSLDDAVLRPVKSAFSPQGGLKLLTGNLGHSVIKVSAVKAMHQVVEAEAVVFDDQLTLQKDFESGKLDKDFIAVVRFQGPKANGMPELHKLTPVLGVLQDKGFKVALVTDGRMSGASGKVPAAIHLCPEALDGGNLAKIRNGDRLKLDALNGTLELLVSEGELAKRPAASMAHNNNEGMGRELFGIFRQQVTPADQGASVLYSKENPATNQERSNG